MKRLLLFLLCQGSLDGWSQTYEQVGHTDTFRIVRADLDTLASHLLITHNPPSFSHSVDGYCVTRNGYCTGKHLVYRSKRNWFFGRRTWSFIAIDPGYYDVWGCKVKEGRP